MTIGIDKPENIFIRRIMYMYLHKIISIFTSLVIISSAVSCSLTKENNDNISTSSNEISSKNANLTNNESSDKISKSKETLSTTDNYSVYLENIGENVFYAQISGMSNESIQNKVNERLKSLETDRYESMNTSYNSTSVIYYSDKDVLSISQIASFNEGGSSETVFNFNMETGEKIKLIDVADIDKLAQKIYNNDGVKIESSYDGAKIEDYTVGGFISSADDVKEDLKRCSFHFDENKNIILHLATASGLIQILVE